MAEKYKVTLDSGKTILFRQMKIKDYHNAAAVAGRLAQGNSALLQLTMQNEILKGLIVEIDGKALSNNEREDLDSMFTIDEYHQAIKFIEGLLGKAEAPKMEMISG